MQLSLVEFKQLIESVGDQHITIYLPTHTAGPDIQQDPIRLKNLLGQAETELLDAGISSQEVKKMLKTASSLLDDHPFWRYQSQGLALFITSQATRIYRLPLEFEPLVTITDRFHLKPLLPLFFNNRYYYILALSQNLVRLFQATRHQVVEIQLQNVPISLAEALKYDDPEKQLQYHSGSSNSQPIYHGQATSTDDSKLAIKRFFTEVESGLQAYLKNEDAPLVVAAVDYLQPIYQAVNTYPHLLDQGIPGNPDVAKPDDLREAAWSKVAALIERSHLEALNQYRAMQGTGKTTNQLPQLLLAAYRGQVETLFIPENAHVWGLFDPDSGQLTEQDGPQLGNYDLLDLAAMQTFSQGGIVYTLDPDLMPDRVSTAAVYRYSNPIKV